MRQHKILIVEDEMITSLDLRNELTRLGYRVVGLASSGDEAVQLAKQTDPDLVLMDLKLKGAIGGIETSKRIQEAKAVPVIYLTAHPSTFISAPSKMQKPYLCVSKPVSIPDLQVIIGIALGQKIVENRFL